MILILLLEVRILRNIIKLTIATATVIIVIVIIMKTIATIKVVMIIKLIAPRRLQLQKKLFSYLETEKKLKCFLLIQKLNHKCLVEVDHVIRPR